MYIVYLIVSSDSFFMWVFERNLFMFRSSEPVNQWYLSTHLDEKSIEKSLECCMGAFGSNERVFFIAHVVKMYTYNYSCESLLYTCINISEYG